MPVTIKSILINLFETPTGNVFYKLASTKLQFKILWKLINLEGDIVYLSLDSLNQFCEESLPGNLPEDAYLVRISGNDHYLYEKLLAAEEC